MKLTRPTCWPPHAHRLLAATQNTSSSTTWYSFAYCETVGDVKKGHTLMQVCCGWVPVPGLAPPNNTR
jgi:hypothetical protein